MLESIKKVLERAVLKNVQQCIRKGSSQVKFTFLPEAVRETEEKDKMEIWRYRDQFVFSFDLCLRETKIYNLFQRNQTATGLYIYKDTPEYREEKRKRAALLLLLHCSRYFISNSFLYFLCELFVVWVLEKLWKCIFWNRLCSI